MTLVGSIARKCFSKSSLDVFAEAYFFSPALVPIPSKESREREESGLRDVAWERGAGVAVTLPPARDAGP